MSRQIRLPALQPNQRRTARNVSRASSSPDEHLQLDAGLLRAPGAAPCRCCSASRTAEVAKASSSSHSSAVGLLARVARRRGPARRRPCRSGRRRLSMCSARRSSLLSRMLRRRLGAAVRVDDQQMHGVRPDVEHAEAHAADPITLARMPRTAISEVVAWTFPASGSSSTTRPTPTTGSAPTSPGCARAGPASSAAAATARSPGQASTGCCNHGAYFSDHDDEKRVRKFAEQLTRDDWQLYDEGAPQGGKLQLRRRRREDDEENRRKTRVVDGACIFANREDHRRRHRLRAARARAAHRHEPARDQARGLLAAAGAPRAGVGRPARRHPHPALDDRRVRPARLGRGRPRPGLVLHVLAGGARRRRADVRLLRPGADRADRRAGLRRTGAGVPRPAQARPGRRIAPAREPCRARARAKSAGTPAE